MGVHGSLLAVVAGLLPWSMAMPLRWDAPPSCPDQVEVQTWLDGLVSPTANGRARARVDVVGDRYRLELAVTTDQGDHRRTLEADDCEPLARAAVVVVAVELDPATVTAQPSAVPTPSAAPEPLEVVPPPAAIEIPSRESDPKSSPRPLAVMLGLHGGAGTGVLPEVHGVGEVRVGARARHVRFELTATHRFGRVVEHAAGGGARIRLPSGGLWLGPWFERGSWAVALLAGLQAGAMVASGQGLTITRTVASPWLGASLRPAVAVALAPRVALTGDLTLTGSLLRPRFRIDDGPLIHTTSALGARVGLGLEFRLLDRQSARDRRLSR